MTTYYVDSTRPNDTGNGLSLAAAKKTIQAAINLSPAAGDVVELYGGPFRETVTLGTSGSAGNPITMRGAVGQTPIITGAEAMTGFTGGPIWDKTGVTTQPRSVVLQGWPPKDMAASKAACVAPGDWFWAANLLSVYSIPDPNGLVEVSQRQNVIHGNGKNYWTLTDLILKGSNTNCCMPGGAEAAIIFLSGGATGWTLSNVTVTESGGFGIYSNGDVVDTTFDTCDLSYNGGCGFCRDGTAGGGSNFKVLSCDIIRNGFRKGTVNGYAGGLLITAATGEVAYCTIENNGISDGVGTRATEHGIYFAENTGASFSVHHNYIRGQSNGTGTKSYITVDIHHNVYEDNSIGIGCQAVATVTYDVVYTIRYNLIFNSDFAGIYQQNVGTGTRSLIIEHNTLYKNALPNFGAEVYTTTDMLVFTMRNNLFWVPGGQNLTEIAVAPTGTVSIDYNDYWRDDGAPLMVWGGVSKTFATWRALGHDAHGLNVNPLYVQPGVGDFRLQVGSPAINAGVAIPGVNDDHVGAAPDMGALEYGYRTLFQPGSRVWETTTTIGIGDIQLLGGTAGYQAFSAIPSIRDGDLVEYTMASATQWEAGYALWRDTNRLQRVLPLESSNGNELVSFTAGTKDVICTPVARRSMLGARASAVKQVVPDSTSLVVKGPIELLPGGSLVIRPGAHLVET